MEFDHGTDALRKCEGRREAIGGEMVADNPHAAPDWALVSLNTEWRVGHGSGAFDSGGG